jgi:alginate O-acetyltransferase complex protein AlgI
MLFNSYEFLFVFLPITLLGFFGLLHFNYFRGAISWLLVTSLIFYGYWNPAYLPLLLVSIVGNYLFGYFIQKSVWVSSQNPDQKATSKSSHAKYLLWFGIAFNLGMLGYYKYAEFLLSSVNSLLHTGFPVPSILLPLAISFYSFTQIAYLVDAYRGETQDQNYDLISYTLFVSFFPQLIAGPILRHSELIPQLKRAEHFAFSHKNIALGLLLFMMGLAKKVLIADRIAPAVALVFDHATEVSFVEAWIGALSYTFQLYFDFSGYSDMAIALGWMFNIQLPINFDSPYKAVSIIDFWRRWHITLSHFLRDYLYISLGGNRLGQLRQYGNLLITMVLGGLWHGAGWTFVMWGGLHGSMLVINHTWRRIGIRLPAALGWGMTFVAIVMSWVMFRAATLADALSLWSAMLGLNGIVMLQEMRAIAPWLEQIGVEFRSWQALEFLPPNYKQTILLVLVLLGVVVAAPNTQQIVQRFQPNGWWAIALGGISVWCLLSLNQVSEFLYFQF